MGRCVVASPVKYVVIQAVCSANNRCRLTTKQQQQQQQNGEEEERTAEGRRERRCLTASLGDDDPAGLSQLACLFLLAAPLLLGEAGSGRVLLFCFLVGLLATVLLLCRLQPQLGQHSNDNDTAIQRVFCFSLLMLAQTHAAIQTATSH